MDNVEDKCEEILNKKFKKAVFSGYDTADVDAFFDEVIEYVEDCHKSVELYKEDVQRAYDEIDKRDVIIAELEKEKAKLLQEVADYKEEGYGNMLLKHRNQRKQGE